MPIVITMSSARAASAARSASSKPPAAGDPIEQLLRPSLDEGHPARPERLEDGGVVVDAENAVAPVGEAQRQGQPDAAQADHGHVSGAAHRFELSVVDAGDARQRIQPGLGGMAADLAGERDPVQPGDLALALDAGRMVRSGAPRISLRIRSRS